MAFVLHHFLSFCLAWLDLVFPFNLSPFYRFLALRILRLSRRLVYLSQILNIKFR